MSYQRATKYLEKNNAAKAIPLFKKSLIHEGEYKETYLNLGNCYRLQDNVEASLAAYLKANSPSVPFFGGKFTESYDLALSNLGLHSYMLGRDDEAIAFYGAALKENPMHFDCIWNYSNALLRKWCSREDVDVAGAWKMYSYRFKRANPVALDRALPLWDGVSRVSAICVLAEQGMGDKIQFGRYISRLKNYCDRIVVQVPPELEVFFSDYEVCQDSSGSGCDVGVPICALAARFEDMSFPLYKSSVDAEWLRGKFTGRKLDGDFKIGIVYSGSPTHANDRNRSMPGGYFSALANFGSLYCLTPNARSIKGITNLDPKSWLETIEYILGLDLVVSVDTSVVHVCGSLGVPCLMMQPIRETDFRWGYGGDSIWYPSVHVLQNPGTWEKMMAVVSEKVKEFKRGKLTTAIVDFFETRVETMGREEILESIDTMDFSTLELTHRLLIGGNNVQGS